MSASSAPTADQRARVWVDILSGRRDTLRARLAEANPWRLSDDEAILSARAEVEAAESMVASLAAQVPGLWAVTCARPGNDSAEHLRAMPYAEALALLVEAKALRSWARILPAPLPPTSERLAALRAQWAAEDRARLTP